ncbi:MAG: hypothetical protein HOW73_14450 [Polyangiaceae bacterium]|nr:hypothetical protein [Polyangiaceae bacterium]
MEPRRCGVHGLVLGVDGRCVICRRGDPETAPAKTSSDWPIVAMLAFVGLLLAGSGAYWVGRKLTADQQPAAQQEAPPPAPTEEAAPAPPPERQRDPFKGDDHPAFVETPPVEVPASAEQLTEEELAKLRKRVVVTMYMRNPCQLCDRARTFLKTRDLTVKELDIDASGTDKVLLESINPAGTVPTFDIDGKVLVGYDTNALVDAIDKAAVARSKRDR